MNGNSFTVFTEPVALLKRSPGLFLPNAGVFSRLFPELPPHEPGGDDASAAVRALAREIYDDGGDDVPANPGLPAGYTFFAQFVAHDMSFDPSRFGQRSYDGVVHANLRTPRLDLDHVYGGDPDLNSQLYETDERGQITYRFLIDQHRAPHQGQSILVEDLPRCGNRALIPDQRDDQHAIVNQLHLALLKLHNVMMDRYALDGQSPRATFFRAQRAVRWQYQYAIVNDLLPRLLGEAGMVTFDAYRQRWLGWQREMVEPPVTALVPVEFSVGVYRVGHSTLRSAYRVNGQTPPLPLFPKDAHTVGDPTSLIGFGPRHPSLVVSWDRLLEVQGREQNVQRARVFGDTLSKTLSRVPGTVRPGSNPPRPDGLAELDLERGLRLGLPAGQAVAHRLGVDEIEMTTGNDPLWYYAMKEVRDGGNSVGPVAAAIITKVFLDLLHLDPGSYLYQQPTWRPARQPGLGDGLASLLSLAGMPFSDEAAFAPAP